MNDSVLVFLSLLACIYTKNYEPTWNSLDKRPIPSWFDEVKIGIFIHWGVYSVPSYEDEWFWYFWRHNDSALVSYMQKNYPPNFSYQEFANDFSAEFFNATEWVDIFKNSGAKYVILTTKHHEGFTLWPSECSFSWRAKKDYVKLLRDEVEKVDLKFGVYYSQFEWFNPTYLSDKNANYTKQDYVLKKTLVEMKDLVNRYKPEIFWSDGSIESDSTYWKAPEFIAWLYNESPVKDTVVVNDRWGKDASCKHGDYLTCSDRFNPGELQPKKWENAMSLDTKSFGYRRNAKLSDYLTIEQLIRILLETVSFGGNMLINVGPTKEGVIVPVFEERLRQLGSWLKVNGEGIYNSSIFVVQNDTNGVFYTKRNDQIFFILFDVWPADDNLILTQKLVVDLFVNGSVNKVHLLGYTGIIKWNVLNIVTIKLPKVSHVNSKWAYTLRVKLF